MHSLSKRDRQRSGTLDLQKERKGALPLPSCSCCLRRPDSAGGGKEETFTGSDLEQAYSVLACSTKPFDSLRSVLAEDPLLRFNFQCFGSRPQLHH